jgi:hypothetical protein
LVIAIAMSGCGPIEYVQHVTMGANDKVEAARAADAEKWSPYWWTRAKEYQHEAKVQAAYAHFQAANRFGELSEEAATKAREEALRRAADPAAAAKEMGPIDGGKIDTAPAEPKSEKKKDIAPVEDGS